MTETNMPPVSVVENKGSKKLTWYLQPKYYSTESFCGPVR